MAAPSPAPRALRSAWTDEMRAEARARSKAAHAARKAAAAPASAPTATPELEVGPLTEQRAALLRELWPQTEISGADILRRFNALPGRALSYDTSLYPLAKRLGMETNRAAEAAKRAAPAPAAASPEDTREIRLRQAKAMLRDGYAETQIARRTGLPEAEVQQLAQLAELEARDLVRAGGIGTDEIAERTGLPGARVRQLKRQMQEASAA